MLFSRYVATLACFSVLAAPAWAQWFTNITASPSGNSCVISWNSAAATEGRVKYGTTTSYGTATPLDTSYTVSHSATLSGLSSGTIYHFAVVGKDTTSLWLTSKDQTCTTAGQLTSNPLSQAFGSVTVGMQQSASETVTNNSAGSVTISQATISGTGFILNGIGPPLTLAAGQSTSFTVIFAPQAAGSASGNVTLTSDAGNPTLTIPLTGTGVTAGQLTSNPASEAFGNVTVGSQQSASVTLTNSGGSSVTISQATISGTGFSLSGITTPVTLAAGQSTTLTVTFAPQAGGAASGNVTLSSDASNPTLAIALSGTGATTTSHSVSLNWGASTTPSVTYNLYRSVSSGTGYALVASALTSLTYTDTTVVSGTTYYYVVTAFDGTTESAYSNQATATIP
jgi:hypothetical protein